MVPLDSTPFGPDSGSSSERERMAIEAQGSLDPARLAQVAAALEAVELNRGFDRRNSIGKVIFEQLLGGRRKAWSGASAQSQLSFRKLAGLLRGKLSKSELHRSLHVFFVCQELDFVLTSGHLTVSHVDVVLGLSSDAQRQLLGAAHEQRLSVRQLRQLRAQSTGRPAVADAPQRVSALAQRAVQRGRLTSEALGELARGISYAPSQLPSADTAALMRSVDALETSCAELRALIARQKASGGCLA